MTRPGTQFVIGCGLVIVAVVLWYLAGVLVGE